jgi:hypothetical protein
MLRSTDSPPSARRRALPTNFETTPVTGLARALSLLVIALMLGAIVYAAAIAVRYWSAIGV